MNFEFLLRPAQSRNRSSVIFCSAVEPRFYAFDLLWCDGEDLRTRPLIERKRRLRLVVPRGGERLLYCDHIEANGEGLFRAACEHDLEGIVAKQKHSPYLPQERSSWLKIRNCNYSQWVGCEELFERERGRNPDFGDWESCVRACARMREVLRTLATEDANQPHQDQINRHNVVEKAGDK